MSRFREDPFPWWFKVVLVTTRLVTWGWWVGLVLVIAAECRG